MEYKHICKHFGSIRAVRVWPLAPKALQAWGETNQGLIMTHQYMRAGINKNIHEIIMFVLKKVACPQSRLSSKWAVLKVGCPQSRLSSKLRPQRRCPQCRCPQCCLSSKSHRASGWKVGGGGNPSLDEPSKVYLLRHRLRSS